MKALITDSSTTAMPWFRRVLMSLMALLAVAALGIGMVGVRYPRRSFQVTAPASRVDLYAPLDQHERHPAGLPNTYAPLDQHERHPVGLPNTYAPLDQHERHPAGLLNTYAPLDR